MLTQEEYDQKRYNRYMRLLAAAERAEQDSQSSYAQSDKMSSVIPFGQPILVGHYSEARDRRYRERIDQKMRRGWDLHRKSQYYQDRADSVVSNNAISSDDPSAPEQLAAKIAKLEKYQELMKATNKCVRKNDREGLANLGFADTQITKLLTPDFCGRIGFPSYELTNNSANIRSCKERLEKVRKLAAVQRDEKQVGEVKIIVNPDVNRVQIIFPGKPEYAVRQELKSHGFHWSPQEMAWQRLISGDAKYWAEYIAKKYYS